MTAVLRSRFTAVMSAGIFPVAAAFPDHTHTDTHSDPQPQTTSPSASKCSSQRAIYPISRIWAATRMPYRCVTHDPWGQGVGGRDCGSMAAVCPACAGSRSPVARSTCARTPPKKWHPGSAVPWSERQCTAVASIAGCVPSKTTTPCCCCSCW